MHVSLGYCKKCRRELISAIKSFGRPPCGTHRIADKQNYISQEQPQMPGFYRHYFVCQQCVHTWFGQLLVEPCPRCRCMIRSQGRFVPPWLV